jgi:nanoRNase/pAp phosphatase (c-di-AMP/oligoRNAs hydrolase)
MDTQRLKEIFDKNGAFAIVVGQNYSVDEMGSALSIYLTLESINKNVSIISAKQPLVEVSNLVGIDQVKPNFESKSGDLIVSFPYQNDEIGKVSYTLESGLLNIIVKPKNEPLSFGEKDVIFKRSSETPEVLITVGVKRISELQAFFDVQSLKDTVIVNIDKVGNNEGFGDVVIVNHSSSSVSEQVASLIMSLDYQMDPDVAQNLMSGVIAATGNFQSPKTSSLAFEMAGVLLRNGARREVARPQREPARTPAQFGYPLNRPNQGSASRQQIPQNRMSRNPGQVSQPISEFPKEQKLDDQPLDRPDDAPPDWLAPKIFKGSTTVE